MAGSRDDYGPSHPLATRRMESAMRKFGEEERKRVIEFVEKERGVSLTAVRGRRKFFLDENKAQW